MGSLFDHVFIVQDDGSTLSAEEWLAGPAMARLADAMAAQLAEDAAARDAYVAAGMSVEDAAAQVASEARAARFDAMANAFGSEGCVMGPNRGRRTSRVTRY